MIVVMGHVHVAVVVHVLRGKITYQVMSMVVCGSVQVMGFAKWCR